jgi:hypothetical protein
LTFLEEDAGKISGMARIARVVIPGTPHLLPSGETAGCILFSAMMITGKYTVPGTARNCGTETATASRHRREKRLKRKLLSPCIYLVGGTGIEPVTSITVRLGYPLSLRKSQ